ncbi:hypothetical protein Q4508_07610 [Amphritea sp. 2_MG-2023]|uniref:hypothetical protein n=1 Tax=Amphritea TaxID=515417 RepID=UPI001C0723E2|nr:MULTISPECIES: hypothetical protein [Amphritea]MBU2967542.1 hypothetical protein [Amphritea atlantica]MDO6418420.1 hypothetical protein [Amphritea sp. 2_MG-2023]
MNFSRKGDSLPDDLLLAMFLRIWNNRGQLELLARWLYESDEPAQGIWPHRRYSRLSEKIEHVSPSQTWLANVETRRWPESYCQFPTPCYGGTNPLNLGITFVADTKPTAQPTISSCDGHFSTIVMQDLQGWYRVLCEYAKNEGRSVRTVQLFSAQHGQIATMRRSLESGLWFACRHEVHQWGH